MLRRAKGIQWLANFRTFSQEVRNAPVEDDGMPMTLKSLKATTIIGQSSSLKRPVYLDFQATTPMDPRVLDKMLPYLTSYYGNPHSRTHQYGWESEAAVEKARQEVAELIGADRKEIVWTSGATEANNLAIKGISHFYGKPEKSHSNEKIEKENSAEPILVEAEVHLKNHIVTTQTEHKCVLDSCRYLETQGFRVTYLPVSTNGLVDPATFDAALIPGETILASIMMVNNEIGVIQPIKQLVNLAKAKGVFFHTDAAQAIGKIPVDVRDLGVDALSLSGHKIYGPKGVGALYVRRRPRVRLEPLFSGGGQERGLRSGTVPTPLVVGLGAACRVAKEDLAYDQQRITRLSKKLELGLMNVAPHVYRNGDLTQSYPGCLNISFAYIEGESLLMALKDLALSSGSACTSASLEPSYVLRALGKDDEMAHSSIRFGIGRFTTDKEIDYAIERTKETVSKLRSMSPLWEMVQEGIDLKSIQWSQH